LRPVRLSKPHKYRAKACVVDGQRFPSQAEGRRYRELKLREKAGEIVRLELQPVYQLFVPVAGQVKAARVGLYKADFRYLVKDSGEVVVEDVKGVRTPVYRLKKRMVEASYGITITEV
jgi:hypothetical protein